jgi:alkanesulfonate monooxygenase SsuD/methylene tetrahydromethanopterin reductase-like flavin-dependent oxidoreductase (luciferase family)
MRFGVVIIPTDPWPAAVAAAQRVEALGFDHLWTYDHLSWRRYRDQPWHATHPWLTGIAAVTSSIRVGTAVSSPNLRHPLMLAKDAMTIDHVSNGRFIVGIGAGGAGFDDAVFGQAPLSPGDRMARLEEYVEVLDGLLTASIEDHAGRHYTIEGARLLPGCIQTPRIPIAIAAGGPRGLRLAARRGDAWMTYGSTTSTDRSVAGTERAVIEQNARLDDACSVLGRDPSSIDRIYLAGNTEERPLSSIERFVDFVGRYTEIGFTDIVVHHPRADDPAWNDPPEILDQIAARFLPPPPL